MGIRISLVPECAGPVGKPKIFHRGDADANGVLTIGDPVFALNYLFAGGRPPLRIDTIDIDDSGALTIGDPVILLNYLFAGGPPPAAPGPPANPCGPDPTDDDPWKECDYPPEICK